MVGSSYALTQGLLLLLSPKQPQKPILQALQPYFPQSALQPIATAEQLEHHLQTGHWAGIVLDHGLSWHQPLQLAQHLQQQWPHIPVVLLWPPTVPLPHTQELRPIDAYVLKTRGYIQRLPSVLLGAIGLRESRQVTLRRRELQLQQAERLAGLGTWHYNFAKDRLEWSENAKEILGLAQPPINLQAFFALTVPAELPAMQHAWQQALSGHPYDGVRGIQLPQGLRRWHERMQVLLDPAGTPIEAVGTLLDITHQQQTSERLRQRETMLHNAVRLGGLAPWRHDLKQDRFDMSPEIRAMLGLGPHEEVDFARYMQSVDSQDQSQSRHSLHEALQGHPFESVRRIWVKGELKWIHSRAEVHLDSLGQPQEVIGVTQDITRWRQMEEELRQSEARYRLLAENATDVIWTFDPHSMRFTYVSPSVEKLRGFTAAQTVQQTLDQVLTPASRVMVESRLAEVGRLAKGSSQPFPLGLAEHELYRHDGTTVLVEVAGNWIVGPSGEPSVVGVWRDITLRKQAQAALEQNERILRQAQSVAQVGSWVYHLQSGRSEWSDQTLRIFELPQNSQGLKIMDYTHPDDRKRVMEAWKAALNEGLYDLEYRIVVGGKTKWVHERAEFFGDQGQGPTFAIGTTQDISQRKQAEEARQKSDARYRALFELAQDAIVVADPHSGMILEANPQAIQLFNRGAQGLVGQHQHDLHSELGRRQAEQAFAQLAKQQGQFNTQIQIDQPKGPPTVLELRANSFTDVDGHTRFFGFFRDISQQVQAQEMLRISEERYRTLAEAATDMIYIINNRLEVEYVNPTAAKVLQMPAQQAVGLPLKKLFPASAPQMQATLRQVFEHGKAIYSEEPLQTPVGQMWMGTWLTPLHRKDQQVHTVLGISRDTTEHHRIQNELRNLAQELETRVEERTTQLRRSEARLNHLLDNAPVAIFTIAQRSQQTTYVAHSVQAILGYSAQEMMLQGQVGVRIDLVHPQDREAFSQALTLFNSQEVGTLEVRVLHQNGEWRWCRIGAIVVEGGTAEPELVGYLIDIHEQRQAQEALLAASAQLEAANRELTKANRMKDEFLASMSHELRTPLTGIMGLSEVMEQGVYGPLNDKQLQALSTVRQSGQHLLNLINDILDISKIEAGKLELRPTAVNIDDLCHSTLQLLGSQARDKNIGIAFESNAYGLTVQADSKRIKQVLFNLLSNAIKFTPDGGQVGLRVKREAKELQLTVWDTGIGISPQDQEQLFQPFVQIDSRLARKYGGTGLGLSLVKRLTQLHGGHVTLVSQVGQGSHFTVHLPLWPATPSNTANAPVATPPPPQALPPETWLLVVDDNPVTLGLLQDYLQSKGFGVVVAASGALGIELFKEINPAAVLMDIQMPGMDGLEAIRRIRSLPNGKQVPILAVTALAMTQDRERCLAAGASGYIVKPINLPALLQELHLQLGIKQPTA